MDVWGHVRRAIRDIPPDKWDDSNVARELRAFKLVAKGPKLIRFVQMARIEFWARTRVTGSSGKLRGVLPWAPLGNSTANR
eukprot:scaffold55_cov401-Prasinococcus_capsulatus_cf.AAC.13